MTNKELIKQEIERRFNDNMEASEQYTENSKSRALFTSAAKEDYDLLAFIDSLPEEPASEDWEREIGKYTTNHLLKRRNHSTGVYYLTQKDCDDIARHFAEWGRNHFEDKSEMVSVKTIIVNDWQYGKDPDHAIIPAIHQRIDGFNVGDKVKIIIVKEDYQ